MYPPTNSRDVFGSIIRDVAITPTNLQEKPRRIKNKPPTPRKIMPIFLYKCAIFISPYVNLLILYASNLSVTKQASVNLTRYLYSSTLVTLASLYDDPIAPNCEHSIAIHIIDPHPHIGVRGNSGLRSVFRPSHSVMLANKGHVGVRQKIIYHIPE